MKLLYALQSTGGSPEIRKHIFDVLDLLNIRHNRSVFTAKAFVHIIGSSLKTSNSPELHLLIDSLQDVVSRKVRSPRLTRYLHAHVLSLVKEIGLPDGTRGPISSALIAPDDDDSIQVSRDKRDRRDKPDLLYVAVLYFIVGILTVMATYRRRAEGTTYSREAFRTAFDTPPLLENPDEIIHLPRISERDRQAGHANRQTLSDVSPFMIKHGATFMMGYIVDLQTHIDNYAQKLEDEFMNGRILSASDRHVLVSAIKDREQHGVDDKEVISCLELVLHSVDPIYLPASERLVVNLSSTLREGTRVGGLYKRYPQHIWVASPSLEQPVSLSDRAYVLYTLVHEVAHHVHLGSDRIASGTLSGNKRPAIERYSRDDIEALMLVRDEVFAVLHLGVDSDNINYEEAVWLNKMILDIRIKNLYQNALESEMYQGSKYWEKWSGSAAYWRTNHKEYFAEASTAYLTNEYLADHHGRYFKKFPPREWIRENDPGLYSLLDEVWSMAPSVSFDS